MRVAINCEVPAPSNTHPSEYIQYNTDKLFGFRSTDRSILSGRKLLNIKLYLSHQSYTLAYVLIQTIGIWNKKGMSQN